MAKRKSSRGAGSNVGRGVAKAFPRLAKNQVTTLAAGAKTKSYTIGETVIREGTYANGFYVVINGQADVSQLDKSGKDVRLRRLGPGDFFGEIGLLAPPRRTATVRARTDLEIAALNSDQFFGLMSGSEQTAVSVSRVGTRRLARKAPAPRKATAARKATPARKAPAARKATAARQAPAVRKGRSL